MKMTAIYVGHWYFTSRLAKQPGKCVAVSDAEVKLDFGKLGIAPIPPADVVREATSAEMVAAQRGTSSCVCQGLGAYIDWNGSTDEPEYIVAACGDHPLGRDADESEDDRASARVEGCLTAVAAIRDIVWPAGDPDAEWTSETIEDVTRAIGFLRPDEPPALKPARVPRHTCARCKRHGVYLSPNSDEWLCHDHRPMPAELGGCGACLMGIVIDAETNEVQACNDCGALGSGFGTALESNDDAAAQHVLKILKAVAKMDTKAIERLTLTKSTIVRR